MDILAALTLGIVGSLHCIGMCGPLVLAVPGDASSRWKFIAGRLIYNGGKAVTYGILGVIVGLAGKGLLMNYQQDLSIIVGVTMMVGVLIPFGLKSKLGKYSPLQSVYTFVRNRFSILLKKRGSVALFGMGMLNGLLPCGLVYTALIGATVVADAVHSALFMMMFGIGTAPALLLVSLSGKIISLKFRPLLAKATPLLTLLIALILILRGLNLGIPYISPKVSSPIAQEETMECCSPEH